MENERIVELLNIEKECIQRADSCDRNCAKCDLVQDSNELIQMYTDAIEIIDKNGKEILHTGFRNINTLE